MNIIDMSFFIGLVIFGVSMNHNLRIKSLGVVDPVTIITSFIGSLIMGSAMVASL